MNIAVYFPIITAFALIVFYIRCVYFSLPRIGTAEWITFRDGDSFSLSGLRFRLDRGDILPIIIITAVCAVISFLFLGSHIAPESFFRFEKPGDSAVIELENETDISDMMYYTGLMHGSYTLEFSSDGQNWSVISGENAGESSAMPQAHGELFKWQLTHYTSAEDVRFIRITADKGGMELGEIALFDASGKRLDTVRAISAPELFDEQSIVPDSPSWYNGMIFDEIYHGRTAYEHLRGIAPYETTHPPLGKLIIAVGIALFGMNPFGWRFMGTLFGVLMLPLLYIFLKWLFGKRTVAVCGSLLFAFEFMRFTQTRLATIDTYSVFFTLLSYMFMYRFVTEDYDAPLRKSLLSLFLSGLFFGLNAACKWTGFYAGAGLAVIYILHHILVGGHYLRKSCGDIFTLRLLATVGFSILFFIVIPAVIYYLSYIPYGMARGMTPGPGMLFDREFLQIVLDNQTSMFSYHGGLTATHPYQSAWYQWIFDARPILYYLDTENGLRSSISAFGNPVVWWGGLGAVIILIYRIFSRRDGRALFITVGYLAVLLPWVFIPRCAFAYHYFPASLFLCLAIAHAFDTVIERGPVKKLSVYCFTGAAALLFAAYYPVLAGIPVPAAYSMLLRWGISSWPL